MKRIRSTFIVILLAGSFGIIGCQKTSAPRLTLVLDDAAGLDEGARVVYRGIKVGEVENVRLEMSEAEIGGYAVADLVLESDIFAGFYEQMDFRVKRESLIEETKQVNIFDRRVNSPTPLASGATVVETSYLEHVVGRSGDVALDMLDEFGKRKGGVLSSVGRGLIDLGTILSSADEADQ